MMLAFYILHQVSRTNFGLLTFRNLFKKLKRKKKNAFLPHQTLVNRMLSIPSSPHLMRFSAPLYLELLAKYDFVCKNGVLFPTWRLELFLFPSWRLFSELLARPLCLLWRMNLRERVGLHSALGEIRY